MCVSERSLREAIRSGDDKVHWPELTKSNTARQEIETDADSKNVTGDFDIRELVMSIATQLFLVLLGGLSFKKVSPGYDVKR